MDARRARLIRLGYAGAFACLFALAFPFRAGDLLFDGGLACGWVALVPFARMLRGLAPRAAFAWASSSATLGFCGVLFWIYVVVAEHGGAHPLVAVLAVVLLALANGLHVGAAAALAAALEPRAGRLAFLVLPASWLVLEHLRGVAVFGGFPWAFLGHSAHANGPMRELAALAGVSGLTFLLAVFAALASRRRIVPALALLVVAHLAGFGLLLSRVGDPVPEARERRVAIIQGNIPQGVKWDPAFAAEAFRAHLETSRLAAASAELELIVWPEAAVPAFLEVDGGYREELSALAVETGALLLVGAPALRATPREGDYLFFNSVFVFTPDGELVDRYDKTKLVPFGEYVPLRWLLGLFLEGVATGIAFADITPGPGPRTHGAQPGFGGDHALTSLICYEVIYPGLVRRAVRNGARVLVNVTNDAWYGRTSGPHQFVAIAALRSAEHGLPMIRAANTGVSAIIDSGGLVLERTPIFERRALVGLLPPARSGPTLYTRLGDWVVWVCWIGLIVIGGRTLVARHRGQGDRGRAQGSG